MFTSTAISKLPLHLVKHKRTEHTCEQADWNLTTLNYEGSEMVVLMSLLYFFAPNLKVRLIESDIQNLPSTFTVFEKEQ